MKSSSILHFFYAPSTSVHPVYVFNSIRVPLSIPYLSISTASLGRLSPVLSSSGTLTTYASEHELTESASQLHTRVSGDAALRTRSVPVDQSLRRDARLPVSFPACRPYAGLPVASSLLQIGICLLGRVRLWQWTTLCYFSSPDGLGRRLVCHFSSGCCSEGCALSPAVLHLGGIRAVLSSLIFLHFMGLFPPESLLPLLGIGCFRLGTPLSGCHPYRSRLPRALSCVASFSSSVSCSRSPMCLVRNLALS